MGGNRGESSSKVKPVTSPVIKHFLLSARILLADVKTRCIVNAMYNLFPSLCRYTLTEAASL